MSSASTTFACGEFPRPTVIIIRKEADSRWTLAKESLEESRFPTQAEAVAFTKTDEFIDLDVWEWMTVPAHEWER